MYAIALASNGDRRGAITSLEAATARMPGGVDLWLALAGYRLDEGDRDGAREAARSALRLQPEHPTARELLRRLGAGP